MKIKIKVKVIKIKVIKIKICEKVALVHTI